MHNLDMLFTALVHDLHDLHNIALAWSEAVATTLIFTQTFKHFAGRLRPSYYAIVAVSLDVDLNLYTRTHARTHARTHTRTRARMRIYTDGQQTSLHYTP